MPLKPAAWRSLKASCRWTFPENKAVVKRVIHCTADFDYAVNLAFSDGAYYIKNELHLDPQIAVTTSNFIGDAFAIAAEFGFNGALLVGHIGKLIKAAGGMFNTHSRYGDCRMEIFAAHAGMCGASANMVRSIMDSAMTDDMLAILDEAGLREAVMESVMERMHFHLTHRPVGGMTVGAVTFSNVHGILGKTADADKLLEQIRKEY